jgi:hypothetical protein
MSTHFDLSEELATFLDLDSKNVPRYQIIKKVCEYVRDNELVDNDNKIVYRCDNELHHFMKKDTFAAFSIIRDLQEHLTTVPLEESYPNQIILENGYGERLSIRAYTIDDQQIIRIQNFEVPEDDLYEYLDSLTNRYEDNKRSKKLEMLFIGFFGITICSLWLAILFSSWR